MTATTIAPATGAQESRGDRFVRWAVEFQPAFLVSLLLMPFVISKGTFVPYAPNTIDLNVYHLAVQDMVAGRDIYLTSTPGDNLKFIYPPIAAVLLTPLLVGPYWLWQIVWTAIGTWAQQSVLRRCGVQRGWVLGLLGAVAVVCVEPLRTTMGYGQINTMLMALVVADLMPTAPGERRLIPRGTLIGLAAAIKLTPLLFLVFLVFVKRWRAAVVGGVSFAAWTVVGFLLLPSESVTFWAGLTKGQVNTAGPVYVGNQGISGALTRWFAEDAFWIKASLLVGFAVAGLATLAAAYWWRNGERVFAVALVGLATCLASPLSWTHHHVWVLPLLVAVTMPSRLPTWAVWGFRLWALWISICLPLTVLPYGSHKEVEYTAGQDLVGNLGPTLGSLLAVALFCDCVVRVTRSRTLVNSEEPAPN